MTHSPADVRRLLALHDLAPRRELGQNFVADPNTVRRIARLSGVGPGDHVVEIGPGLGSLTLALVETGAHVTAVEVDPRLVSVCREVVAGRAVIVEADAGKLDWAELAQGVDQLHVVANLPYNIGTSLLIDILAGAPVVQSLLVMVQTEVAQRLVAGPGSRAYGIPSVLVARYANAEIVGRVPPTVFIPRPKVESSLVQMRRHVRPPVDIDHERLRRVLGAGFGQRRKMLRRSLRDLVDVDALVAIGIDPTSRAEDLDLLEWSRIAGAVDSTP